MKVHRVEHKDTKQGPWATRDCPLPSGFFYDCSVRPLPEHDGLPPRSVAAVRDAGVQSKKLTLYHLSDLGIFGAITPGDKIVPPLIPTIHTRDGDWTSFGFPPWVWLTTDAETIPHEDGCTTVCLTIEISSADHRLKPAAKVLDLIKETPWPELMQRCKRTFWTFEGIIPVSAYTDVKIVEGGRRKPWWVIGAR